jgi:hypothetical protein
MIWNVDLGLLWQQSILSWLGDLSCYVVYGQNTYVYNEYITVQVCNVPHRLMCWMLDPQLVVLFWEVVETLGGGAWLEEVGFWGSVFGGCVLSLGAVSCLQPMAFLSLLLCIVR